VALKHERRNILEAPLRRPWLVLVWTVGCLVGATAIGMLVPPRYHAAAIVRAEWPADDTVATARAGLDIDRLHLSDVRLRVLSRGAVEGVSVTARGADTFVIECEHGDPSTAALVSNRLAGALVAEADRERATQAATDPRLLQSRLVEARRAMDEKRTALESLPTTGDRVAPVDAASAQGQKERLETEKRAVAVDLASAKVRAERLRSMIAAGEPPPTSEAGDPVADLAQLRAERAELRKRYTEEHPDVEALDRRIRRLEAAGPLIGPTPGGARSLQGQLDEIDAEIDALNRKAVQLDAEISALATARPTKRARPGSASQRDLETLKRDYEQAKHTVLALQNDWRAAETAARLGHGTAPRIELVEAARVPDKPGFPNRLAMNLVGLVLGLMLGLLAAAVAELRDSRIRNPEDLQAILPQPLLATIPEVRTRNR
jgi:uncharacterized protein involved in exopolysaccharide biosynthesis